MKHQSAQGHSIKLAVTDHHPIVLQGIHEMLRNMNCITDITSYTTATELLNGLKIAQPHVLLLDTEFPDKSGIELISMIKTKFPEISMVVFTGTKNPYVVAQMITSGCIGYFSKAISPHDMRRGIETVHKKEQFLCGELKDKIVQLLPNSMRQKRKVRFSQREKEILILLASEYTNKEIATTLSLSIRTVENLRHKLITKLEVKNLAGLAKTAVRWGFVS